MWNANIKISVFIDMPAVVWNVSLLVCFSFQARTFILHLCAFSLYRSVSAECASTAQTFTNPHSAPGSLFWQFFVGVLCSLPLLVPALAFLLHSFCPTVDEDTAARCWSSLWLWSALMDTRGLVGIQKVYGLMLCKQSLHETCWSYFCCTQAAPSGILPSPLLLSRAPRLCSRRKHTVIRSRATVAS